MAFVTGLQQRHQRYSVLSVANSLQMVFFTSGAADLQPNLLRCSSIVTGCLLGHQSDFITGLLDIQFSSVQFNFTYIAQNHRNNKMFNIVR